MKNWLRIWKCVFLHDKEIRVLLLPDKVFPFESGQYKGCAKCDIWRKIDS
jgi:hypothetical protein